MKAEKIMFVNHNRFREYAVRYKKNALSPWEWMKDVKGRPLLMSEKVADLAIQNYKNG